MKSRTSFFNGRVLWKDIRRFCPIWGLYSLLLILQLERTEYVCQEQTYPLLVYGVICALALFGDLYSIRRCNALHAMPMRREGWFLTHSFAGVLFFLVPTFVYFLIALLQSPGEWRVFLYGMGSNALIFCFFFGLALLCIMLAGNRIGAVALYGIANFLPLALRRLLIPYLAASSVYPELPPELRNILWWFPPVARIESVIPGYYWNNTCIVSQQQYYWHNDFSHLLRFAGAGIVLAGLALLLYRRRRLEITGNLLSVKWLEAVIAPAVALMIAAAIIHTAGFSAQTQLIMLSCVTVSFFLCEMLRKRSVRVFQLKALLVLAGLLMLLFGGFWLSQTASP